MAGEYSSTENVIIGGFYNRAGSRKSGGHQRGVLIGGRENALRAGGFGGFVAGGHNNTPSGYYSGVFGGKHNLARGPHSTITGGIENNIGFRGYASSIAGGLGNHIEGTNEKRNKTAKFDILKKGACCTTGKWMSGQARDYQQCADTTFEMGLVYFCVDFKANNGLGLCHPMKSTEECEPVENENTTRFDFGKVFWRSPAHRRRTGNFIGRANTINGGYNNTIMSAYGGSISGGQFNSINTSWTSVISGGTSNVAKATGSVIVGGRSNKDFENAGTDLIVPQFAPKDEGLETEEDEQNWLPINDRESGVEQISHWEEGKVDEEIRQNVYEMMQEAEECTQEVLAEAKKRTEEVQQAFQKTRADAGSM